MVHRLFLPVSLVFILAVTASPLLARPPHKKALADHFGPFLAKKLNDCRTCHVPDQPGAKADEKPHNAFGARLVAVRRELRKAGKKTSLIDRLDAVAGEDSDGDGAANIIEILTGHYPGEKDDQPSAQEVARGKEKLTAFVKSRKGYPWRPFDKVLRPPVPAVKNKAWVRNPVDAFIAAEREALGLKPRPEAPRAVLLRRLYIDLTGLPPTRKELHDFLKDTTSDAYEKVVERLLNSPRYGERWGKHWMDIWRYSDWAGYGAQVRDSKPHIWHWRDWIIEALNEDKGYDRMIAEMLAADELYPNDMQALRATGYLVRNYKLLSREKWMQDSVEHTAQAFLGITMKCCKCHDHMYDPITQKEYYQFRAIFEPYHVRDDRLPGQPDTKKNAVVRVYDKNLTVPTYLFIRGDDRRPDKSTVITPGAPDALGGDTFRVEQVNLPPEAYAPGKRRFVIEDTIKASAARIEKAKKALKGGKGKRDFLELQLRLAEAHHRALLAVLKVEKLEDVGQKNSPAWKKAALAAAAVQREASLLQAKHDIQASKQTIAKLQKAKKKAAKKLAVAQKKLKAAQLALKKAEANAKKPVNTQYQPRKLTIYPKTSTGRRTALARWLANRDNPLTARVAVNHIWQRHFGEGIVPTTADFGRNGRPPSHPALLDWLAVEFMENGWSMKHIHRLIVTSSTYRMASTPDSSNLTIDPDNKYLWRFSPRRAEAEVVRDSLFYVAGKLDLTMGGKEIPHKQGMTVPRRSLYFQHAAERQMQFLQIFDGASVVECYERRQSIVPQQSLALFNNELTRRHARILARSLSGKMKANRDFITAAFEQVLSRAPTAREYNECHAFLGRMTKYHKECKQSLRAGNTPDGRLPSTDPVIRAREQLVHVLMNHHEFVTIR